VIDNESQVPENMPESAPLEASPAPLPSPRVPLWGYKDLLVVLSLAIPSFVSIALLGGIIALAMNVKQNYIALPVEFVGYLVWFVVIALYLRTKYGVGFWRALGWRWQPEYFLSALVGGIALGVAVGITGYLLKTPKLEEGIIQELLRSPITRVMVIISATTVGPVCEELVFRGFVLPLLARTFGAIAAVMLSALPFAILHGPQYKWTWQLVLLIFVAGCAFGWARLRTGSTATSAVMHSAYNSFFFLTYFAQKGIDV
jgi:membrane protease YdiL (CAAX protease family)